MLSKLLKALAPEAEKQVEKQVTSHVAAYDLIHTINHQGYKDLQHKTNELLASLNSLTSPQKAQLSDGTEVVITYNKKSNQISVNPVQ